MSQLRDQLRTARAEYEAAHYPGDLAGEVLPALRRPLHLRRWVLLGTGFGAGSLAAAAAIALALLTFLPNQSPERAGQEMLARVTSSGPFGVLSQLPTQLAHLTTVVPVETFRSTLHYLGLPPEQKSPENGDEHAPAPDRDHAAA